MRLLVGHDVAVAQWVGDKIGTPMVPPYTALGWINGDGDLAVGFVFFGYIPGGNIDMAVAASGRLTKGILAAVANYVFVQVNASRLTVRPPRSNFRAKNILVRAGFVQECVCKRYYGNEDAVQLRALKSECRWLT